MERKKVRKNRLLVVILVSLFLFGFLGCKKDNPKKITIKIPKKNLKKQKKKNLQKIEVAKKEKFKYFLHNDRDPFIPFFQFNKETVVEEEEDIPRTPLTSYSINYLKLKAIMFAKGKKPIAMVETGDKLGLFFTIDDYIGTELFKVIDIKNNVVILQKKVRDFLGNIKIVRKELSIENQGE